MMKLAIIYKDQGRLSDAELYGLKSFEMVKTAYASTKPEDGGSGELVWYMDHLATIYDTCRKFTEAEKLQLDVVFISQK